MKTQYQKAFNLFVNNEHPRECFHKPFKWKDLNIATDAYTLIYLPISIEDLEYDVFNGLDVGRFLPKVFHDPIKIDAALLKQQMLEKSDLIDEMSEGEKECVECGGEGVVECDMEHEHDCPVCEGEGSYDVSQPTGKKIPNPNQLFMLDGVVLRSELLARLIESANLLGVDYVYKTSGKPDMPILFEVQSAYVILMPVGGASMSNCQILELK